MSKIPECVPEDVTGRFFYIHENRCRVPVNATAWDDALGTDGLMAVHLSSKRRWNVELRSHLHSIEKN